MDEVCCEVCRHHLHRHSTCGGRSHICWNVHKRYPNFISGYTGNIPINLCWQPDEHPCETRAFISQYVAPANTLYVVHPSEYLPDGTQELPKIHPQYPVHLQKCFILHSKHSGMDYKNLMCHH